MIRRKITLRLEGSAKNDNHLELSVFAEKVRHFLDFLKSGVKDSDADGVVFHVVHLSHSSPATIECEPIGKGLLPSHAFHAIENNLNFVEEENTRDLSNSVLSTMEQLASFHPESVIRAEINAIGENDGDIRVYKLDDQFREKLGNARRLEERVISTIDGKLEQINIHNNANTFRIYPSLPVASSVSCKFPQELLEHVQGALGSFVSVSGECFYRPDAPFPYKIKVQEMRVLPPSSELPSLSELRGIAPEATGGKSSEQFVRELRDNWGKDEVKGLTITARDIPGTGPTLF